MAPWLSLLITLSCLSSPCLAAPRPFPSPSPSPAISPSPSPTQPPCLVVPPRFPVHQGTVTLAWSDRPALSVTGRNLACGFGYVAPHAQTRWGALNQKLHKGCGQCIAVTCTDPNLCASARTVVLPVMLLDDCGHCGAGDVLLSPLAFWEVTGLHQGSIPAEWFFVPCGPFVDGNIRLDIMPGGNVYYHQVVFSNFAEPIENASINGQKLKPTDWQRWIWTNDGAQLNLTEPLTVELQSISTTVRVATLPGLQLPQQDLGVQF